jgi:hypothetical protein
MTGRVGTAILSLLVVSMLSRPVLADEPQIGDPRGDAVGGQSSADIRTVRFEVVRSARDVASTSPRLLVTMTLTDVASSNQSIRYVVNATVDGCGDVAFIAARTVTGLAGHIETSCSSTGVTPVVRADRNAVSWSVAMSRLLPAVRGGTVLWDFDAYVDVADPALGLVGSGDLLHRAGMARMNPTHGFAVLDYAKGPGPWIMR